jgi:hypothetical protein
MIRIVALFCLAAVLLPTASDAAARSHPRWMVGHWAWVNPKDHLQRYDCPESEFYFRDGYMTGGEDVSRWWVEGAYLVRVTVKPGYGEPATDAGHTSKLHFTRVGRDKLIFRDDGSVVWLVRCEDVPPQLEDRTAR